MGSLLPEGMRENRLLYGQLTISDMLLERGHPLQRSRVNGKSEGSI